jgi:hypothetical protein
MQQLPSKIVTIWILPHFVESIITYFRDSILKAQLDNFQKQTTTFKSYMCQRPTHGCQQEIIVLRDIHDFHIGVLKDILLVRLFW